jgi:branched-chain amino acid aminotransferase
MIWLNGAIISETEARIDPFDRGFTLGDGLFETARAYDGRPFRLEDHLARMQRAAEELEIPLPLDMPGVADAVGALLQANRLEGGDAAIRITLSRGSGPRGYNPPHDPKPTLLIAAAPYTPPVELCSAAFVEVRRNEGSPTSRMKTLGALDNVLATIEAEERGAEEAILCHNAGNVACSARANLFAVIAGRLVTPPVAEGVLPGIARRVVLEIAATLHLGAEERALLPDELRQAEEILLTNSLFEIRSVGRLDGGEIAGRALGARLRAEYRAMTRLG